MLSSFLQELNPFSSCLFVALVSIRCTPLPPPGSLPTPLPPPSSLSPKAIAVYFTAPTRLLK